MAKYFRRNRLILNFCVMNLIANFELIHFVEIPNALQQVLHIRICVKYVVILTFWETVCQKKMASTFMKLL